MAGGMSVKEWVVIHKIKALHDNGKGLSIRAISQELGLSRNTVRKYLRMDENAISEQIKDPSRTTYRPQIAPFAAMCERSRRKWPRPRCATTNPFWTMCRVFSARWTPVSCEAC